MVMLQILVVNNIDVLVVIDIEVICDVLYCQVFGLVCWVECVCVIKDQSIVILVECGLGKVLVGMVKCIDVELSGVFFYDLVMLVEVWIFLV